MHVSTLRKVLGDVKGRSRFIETVPRAGYRFVAPVTTEADGLGPPASNATPVELFELVGEGRAHFLSGSTQHLAAAESAFQAAIALDGSYAPAYAGLALTRCAQAVNRVLPHREAYADAKAAALRALAMDSASDDAQVALGTVLFMSEWDWDAAERSLRRALEINQLILLLFIGSDCAAQPRRTLPQRVHPDRERSPAWRSRRRNARRSSKNSITSLWRRSPAAYESRRRLPRQFGHRRDHRRVRQRVPTVPQRCRRPDRSVCGHWHR